MTTLRIYLEVWCVFFFVCFFFRFLHLLVGRRFVAFPGLFLCLVIVKHLLDRFSLEVFIAISGERKKKSLEIASRGFVGNRNCWLGLQFQQKKELVLIWKLPCMDFGLFSMIIDYWRADHLLGPRASSLVPRVAFSSGNGGKSPARRKQTAATKIETRDWMTRTR